MRINKQKFAVRSSIALVIALVTVSFAGCGKKAEQTPAEPPVEIPEEFESADEIMEAGDSAEMVEKKLEASAKQGVGLSMTAFSFLQMNISQWQENMLSIPGEYTLDDVSATGMSISYIFDGGDVLSYEEGDNFRFPIKDLGEMSEKLFGEDRVKKFVKSQAELPGYKIVIDGKDIVYTPVYPETEKLPQYDIKDLRDNGDGTYTAEVSYYYLNYETGERTDECGKASYILSETDKNAQGYRIVDWSMTVY